MVIGKLYRVTRDLRFGFGLAGEVTFSEDEIIVPLRLKIVQRASLKLKFLRGDGRVGELSFSPNELNEWFERVRP